ncbi:addiction module component [Microcoleus sp. FACHB-1515]|uniref:addiction module component n=1 Tax=Cyanophyceae TaxID=3028117 RepID=UPI0016855E49|nr:addiction module component [Microcoleus sp. FACHB-1515]MBD2091875.1 addiction module component [Microcoleus sp. FACHB-1515]
MTPEQLEIEALALPRPALAELLARLLGYLGQTEEIDQDIAAIWVDEAERRDRTLDENQLSNRQ